jgi:competence ComEA-like helix-hairpin-helix protein
MKLASHERFALGVVALLIAVGGLVQFRPTPKPLGLGGDDKASEAATRLVENVEQEVERSRRRSRPLAPGERIDLNTAEADEIQRLPRVGPALAARIVAHREAHGPFRSLAELRGVNGVGPALLEGIAQFVDVPAEPAIPVVACATGTEGNRGSVSIANAGGPAPETPQRIDINTAGVDELQRLPGIGPALAERIVEWRSVNGSFRTVADLERVPGIGARTRERLTPLIRVNP